MCLAIPMRVVEVEGDKAVVDAGGNRRQVSIALLDDVKVGDYVLIHAGFAISKWTEEEARETLNLWDEIRQVLAGSDEESN